MDRALGVLSVVLVGAAALPFATVERHRGDWSPVARAGRRACARSPPPSSSASAPPTACVRRPRRDSDRAAAPRHRRADRRRPRATRTHHGDMMRVLALSVAVQIIRVLQAWCLGQALGHHAAARDLLRVHPDHRASSCRSRSRINGLGTTQVAFDRFFVPAGRARAAGVRAVGALPRRWASSAAAGRPAVCVRATAAKPARRTRQS